VLDLAAMAATRTAEPVEPTVRIKRIVKQSARASDAG
jgi:hypothetical protein